MATTNELDVLNKYNDLVTQSLNGSSVYIRTKETLMDMFNKGYIKDNDIATVLSNVLTNINQVIVTSAMSTALQWANAEKDAEIKNEQIAASQAKTNEMQLDGTKNRLLIDAKISNTDASTTLINTQNSELQLNGVSNRALKDEQTVVEADKLLSTAKARDVQEAQRKLYVRQTIGFDDNKNIKAFDSQLNTWALLESSGMIDNATLPQVVSDTNLNSTYTKLTTNTDLASL